MRPTTERVREAIFSILGDVSGARVLDLFCGTGALGIEALSRGAARGDAGRHATRRRRGGTSRSSGSSDRAERRPRRRARFLRRAERGVRSISCFCDPPYRLADRLAAELDPLIRRALADGGQRVIEISPDKPAATHAAAAHASARYGDTLDPDLRRRAMSAEQRTRRGLPGQLRPGHQRAPRHHRPRREGLRPGRRRRRQPAGPQAEDAVHRRGAQGVHRGRDRRPRQRRGRGSSPTCWSSSRASTARPRWSRACGRSRTSSTSSR